MDYEEIRQKRMEELKRQYLKQKEEEQRQLTMEMQLQEVLRKILTEEAKSRLSNVRLINKELYLKTAQTLIYLYQNGQINGKVSDELLKKLLEKLAVKRETTIKRK